MTFDFYTTIPIPKNIGVEFTYSSVCDNMIIANSIPAIITPQASCPGFNATFVYNVFAQFDLPLPPGSTFLNVLFFNIPGNFVFYLGRIVYDRVDYPQIILGPCVTHTNFSLTPCSCGTCDLQINEAFF